MGPYGEIIRSVEDDIKKIVKRVNDITGASLEISPRAYLTFV